jgi:hypothetical protein
MEVGGQLHTLAALPPGKEPPVPTGQVAGWPQSQSRDGSEERNSQPLPGLKLLIIQPVAQHYNNELFHLL